MARAPFNGHIDVYNGQSRGGALRLSEVPARLVVRDQSVGQGNSPPFWAWITLSNDHVLIGGQASNLSRFDLCLADRIFNSDNGHDLGSVLWSENWLFGTGDEYQRVYVCDPSIIFSCPPVPGSGSAGSGGSASSFGNGAGLSCDDGYELAEGEEKNFTSFVTETFVNCSLDGSKKYTFSYKSLDLSVQSVSFFRGICSHDPAFHGELSPLWSWDYGPSGIDEVIQVVFNSSGVAGENYLFRFVAD
jgi:hypothetical protein